MTAKEQLNDASGLDRRSLLKKTALAAGVAAWSVPVVQTLAPGTAFAGTYTNCGPGLTLTLIATGPACKERGVPDIIKAFCCNNHTYFLAIGNISCGASCGPSPINPVADAATFQLVWASSGPANTGTNYAAKSDTCPDTFRIVDIGDCSSDKIVYAQVRGTITCKDNKTYYCTYNAVFTMSPTSNNCAVSAPGTVLSSCCQVGAYCTP